MDGCAGYCQCRHCTAGCEAEFADNSTSSSVDKQRQTYNEATTPTSNLRPSKNSAASAECVELDQQISESHVRCRIDRTLSYHFLYSTFIHLISAACIW